jgi:hypothetical protein
LDQPSDDLDGIVLPRISLRKPTDGAANRTIGLALATLRNGLPAGIVQA